VEVESKKHVTNNKQLGLHVFNITKFCGMARWYRNRHGRHSCTVLWNISLNTEIFPKYLMKYFNIKKYRILYIATVVTVCQISK